MELPEFIQIPGMLYKDKDVKSLDRDIYGIIHWYTKLKLKKCVISSKSIAALLGVSSGSVDNSIKKLRDLGYIQTIYDRVSHQREIIPLISYKKESPATPSISSTDEGHLIHRLDGISSTDEHNNIDINKIDNNNIFTNVNKAKPFGNEEINEIAKYFLEVMRIPREDCTVRDSRMYWNHLLKASKKGVEGVKWLIDIASRDEYYKNNITSSKDLYYKRVKLVTRIRGNGVKMAVQPVKVEAVKLNG